MGLHCRAVCVCFMSLFGSRGCHLGLVGTLVVTGHQCPTFKFDGCPLVMVIGSALNVPVG